MVLITDAFNRADSATTLGNADTGQAWTVAEGTWGISSNQAYYVSGGSNPVAYQTGAADCTVTATFSLAADYQCLVWRYADTSNFNFLYVVPGGSTTEVRTKVGGTETVIGTFARIVSGDRVRVRCTGSAIEVLVNGVTVWSGTVTANQSATKYGLLSFTTTARWDDFSLASIAGEAGRATCLAYPAKPASDDFATALALSGTSGSGTIHGLGGTWDATTPEPAVGSGSSATPPTYWLTYTPAGPGTFALNVTKTSCVIELVDADQLGVDAFNDGSGGTANPALTVNVSSIPLHFRVHEYAAGASATWHNIDYSWSFTARTEVLQFTAVDSTVDITPEGFKVSIGNGDPSALVNIAVDAGATIIQVQLDEMGVATGVTVPLPALAKGAHTMSATQTTGGKSASLNFTVTNDPYTYPAAIASDAAPTPVVQTGVVKWVFQDPAPGGEQYIFGVNPADMTSPHPAQIITSETTVAPNGQSMTWEGAPRPMQWEITGTLLTDVQMEAFERFLNLNRRIYLIDHYSRAWKVTVESYDPQPKRPYGVIKFMHDFKIGLLVFGEPVQL